MHYIFVDVFVDVLNCIMCLHYHPKKRFVAKRLATSHHPTHLKIFLEALASLREGRRKGKTNEEMN
jgi:hypothetical protein